MQPEDWKYGRRRAKLIASLRQKGIADERVLRAMDLVPRHRFVDAALRPRAYWDEALPIGHGQTISQPFTVAYQTMMLDVRRGDKVLEVGTGSGYQAAILGVLGAEVYTIERIDALYQRTGELLREMGYRVTSKCGDGTQGWPAFAPYDAIVVTAGATDVPDPLLAQLSEPDEDVRGGRLVIPVGGFEGQTMYRYTRTGPDSYDTETFHDFRFVPLIGED